MPELTCRTAEVIVQAANYPLDTAYSYRIPPELETQCKAGCRVVVPFGKGNKRCTGMIFRVQAETEKKTVSLKPLIAVIDPEPVITEEQLSLIGWLRENTFCSYYDAVRAVLPLAFHVRIKEGWKMGDVEIPDTLSSEALEIYQYLKRITSKSEFDKFLDARETPQKEKAVRELSDAGLIVHTAEKSSRPAHEKLWSVRPQGEDATIPNMTPKQRKVFETLEELGEMEEKELCYLCGVTSAVLTNMLHSGILQRTEKIPSPEVRELPEPAPFFLSEEQQAVFERVSECIGQGKRKCFLLHGVTGSGKTAVFEKLIAHTLDRGMSVLMLLPEIALTPQMAERFTARFGKRIAIIHSGLTLSERQNAYERARKGEADLIIGARSAVFAPLENIGLIIMDEEGERSYKSEMPPRYDTIEVAKQRCDWHSAVLLTASATPTLETYCRAKKGIYELLELKHRYRNAPLPKVEIVNMALEREEGNTSEFSRSLHEAIEENLHNGEQTVLLLNRRGYQTILMCCQCNQPIYCENCSVPMTYHKTDGKLHCHYCGIVRDIPEKCPACGGVHLRKMGFGTQRLEEEIAVRFPDARILRMDADTTNTRYAYEQNFEAFRQGKYDIMLGTQMIGKGLDFPNVTLVGVLSVDKALFNGDYRSYERTFSLITQVVGRGGRGEKTGRAILQTFLPEHYIIRLAGAQDYEQFSKEEFSIRKMMLLPPFCDMCIIGISGTKPEQVQAGAGIVMNYIDETAQEEQYQKKVPLRVMRPSPFHYQKIAGKYRWRIIIKCKNNADFRLFLYEVLKKSCSDRRNAGLRIYADMNGSV